MDLLTKLFFIALIGTPLILFVPRKIKGYLNLFLNLFIAVITTSMVVLVFQEGPINYFLIDLSIIGSVHLKIDELSSIFILVINFTVLTSSMFSIGYLKDRGNVGSLSLHFFSFALLHASMLLVCMSQDLLAFIVFWEIMSLCSFVQVIFESENPVNIKAALNYFIQMHVNVVMLMIAVVWLYNKTGMQNFEALHFYFSSNPNLPLFLIFFVSFGMKAGFIPLHTWLPHADPAAPCPSAGLMSGAMIKLGIYGILRVLTYVEADLLEIGIFIYVISMLTGLYGIIQAAIQKDIKKMLAYSSIENIGIIGMGIGLGVLGIVQKSQLITFMGFAGALMHVINHSLFKSLLFYTSGSVYIKSGTRQIDQLGGIIKKMPVTGALFLVGSLAICGLPPFNGFISEFLIYSGMMGLLHADFSMDILELAALISLVLIGGIAIFSFTRVFGIIFLGKPRSEAAANVTEVSGFMHIPNILIVLVILAIGFAPDIFVKFISGAVSLYMPFDETSEIVVHQFDSISQVGLVSILFVILTITIYVIRTLKVKSNSEAYGPTWGCGYNGTSDKLQYTGASYAGNFIALIKPIVKVKTEFKNFEEKEIFPLDRSLHTESDDPIETKGVMGIVKKLTDSLSIFAKVQDGQTQHYILYAFLFITIMLLLTIFDVMNRI
jgi:hydrogenase-4 component B